MEGSKMPTAIELDEIRHTVAHLSNDALERELAFARGFENNAHPNAVAWLSELKAEAARRKDVSSAVPNERREQER
jgi:hypothetical protein